MAMVSADNSSLQVIHGPSWLAWSHSQRSHSANETSKLLQMATPS